MSRLATTASLLLALGLGACGQMPSMASLGLPTETTANLPEDAYSGAADPMRSAINNTTVAFSGSQLAGRPAAAAKAVAEMEYLQVEVNSNPRSFGGSTTASTLFPVARREWRGALGISPGAAPQAVIDGLFGAVRALNAGQPQAAAAALPANVFTLGGAATLQRLAALPPLPNTNQAAQEASRVLRRGGLGRF